MSVPAPPQAADAAPDFAGYSQRVEAALAAWLPDPDSEPRRLHQAMRYAVLGPGKRVRPALVYATGAALGAPQQRLDASACAVELIHAYSLVHDDLPAMDDDDLRRGRPTCHVRFDEATAILAGDALQALACEILTEPAAHPDAATRLAMIRTLTHASGSLGMAGGQAIDMAAVGRRLDLAALEAMHRRKTGALIQASVRLGALAAAPVADALLDRLDRYARAVGLAFQIVDDLLDEVADTQTLGKTQGADRARDKPTYPALLGLSGAREHAEAMLRAAVESLQGLGEEYDPLRELARFVVHRSR